MLFRAYSKDAEYAGNAERSINHYQMFVPTLTAKTTNEVSQNPNMGQSSGERAAR